MTDFERLCLPQVHTLLPLARAMKQRAAPWLVGRQSLVTPPSLVEKLSDILVRSDFSCAAGPDLTGLL